jgi:alkylation response protein AidB-like acyl-CoA dehydrogenase
MNRLDDVEQAIVDTVRHFVDRYVRPVVRELEHTNTYPEALIERMKQLGGYGLAIPEPHGDVQVSTPCYALVTEELARGWMSLAGAMGGHTVVAKLVLAFGTEDQKQRYLPRMATGELRATMALTEPGGGSDLQALRTTARKEGDEYVVDGTKTWISNARRSGLVALLRKTDPKAQPAHRGISILLVEKGPGFTVSKDLPKLGYQGVESSEIVFDGCCCCTPRAGTTPGSAPTSKPGWRRCSVRRPRWRSRSTRSACTAATAIRRSSTSSVTSGTRL